MKLALSSKKGTWMAKLGRPSEEGEEAFELISCPRQPRSTVLIITGRPAAGWERLGQSTAGDEAYLDEVDGEQPEILG
jgi:hypothetical protein